MNTTKTQEKRYEKVVEYNKSKYDLRNLSTNIIFLVLTGLFNLIVNNSLSKSLFVAMVILSLIYFLEMLPNRKVYWREIK